MRQISPHTFLLFSLLISGSVMGISPFEVPQGDPVGLCECEPVIDGEAASGDDVSTPLVDSGSTPYSGTATLENHGEIRGICNLGPESICISQTQNCEWNLSMSVSITAGTLAEVPAYFKIGGETTALVAQGNGVYSGTSSTSRFDKVGCELTQQITVRIKGATGNNLAEAKFLLRCLDCPAAGM